MSRSRDDHAGPAPTADPTGPALSERRLGSGPPIVFVHGMAVSSRYFLPTMRALSPRYTCRAPDLPGFGHSPDPPSPLDVEGLADALARWLRTAGLTGAALLGNSAGCQFIVDCVARHPDITGPLILVGPTTDPLARTPQQQFARWLLSGLSTDVAQLPLLVVDIRDAGPRRALATFGAVLADRIEDKLPRVDRPLLALRGERDHLVPQRWLDQIAWLAPQGRTAVVPRAAHAVNLTHPRALAREVHAFLTSLQERPV